IKKLECLESLNISRCKLLNCSFHQLFENCKFVKSLRRLYLSHVSLNEQDLQCLKRFINLKELSLNLNEFNLPTFQDYLIAIPLKLYTSSFVSENEDFEKFREYLRSKNINIISRYDYSENIKNEKIKAVNNLENSAGEILMCDVDVAMLSERLPPPPTFHDTNHQPPSSSCQT
ncbi:hypothetical protein CWI39_2907p0010, partial [Hamiltosporidium magnivora]